MRYSQDNKLIYYEYQTIVLDNHCLIFVQLLLRKKAAEELKKEQERKAQERRMVIDERCGQPKDVESASEGRIDLFNTVQIVMS